MTATPAAHLQALSAAFFFAHDLFRFPGEEQWAWLRGDSMARAWSSLSALLDLPANPGLPKDLPLYESEYIAAFDAGTPHPPVPLLESHYNKRDPVPRILHENVLFYSSFGLRIRADSNETADHLSQQLEFVAYLYKLESEVPEADAEGRIVQIRQARRDYLERHLRSWVGEAAEKAKAGSWVWVRNYLELVRALVSAAQEESKPAPLARG